MKGKKVRIVNRFHAYAGMHGIVTRAEMDEDRWYTVWVHLENGKEVMLDELDVRKVEQ